MSRITKKFLKYFLITISCIVLICFILSSLFLSKLYISQQYSTLSAESNTILGSYLTGYQYKNNDFKGVLVDSLTHEEIWSTQNKGMMHGMNGRSNNFFSHFDYSTLEDKGTTQHPNGTVYLYYKKPTTYGDLYVFRSKIYVDNYLKIIYLILGIIFLIGIIISIPMAILLGKKFTTPVLNLKKNAEAIASGAYSSFSLTLENTNDELEDLSYAMEHMKNQLSLKDKLQREFIANVSHDFKTPLSIIRNCNEAIYDDLLDKDGVKAYSNSSIVQVDRLNKMVSNIMHLSKLQSLEYPLNRKWVNISEFISSIEKDFTIFLNEKNISLNVLYSDEISDKKIFIDEHQLHRCMVNFLSNSAIVTPNDSYITLRIYHVNSDVILGTAHGESSSNNYIKISIEDNGPGIDDDLINLIWDRYTKNSQSGGMGLGLAINKEILTKHNFLYDVKNAVDGGAIFSFYIPNKHFK
ncbi:HAMP domain-containing sensor histidine kinase [Oceanirhabdus seepicola]|uniref:histidine kinase n=1 Tax=Oceanirhabdus seepicola TaxID=2828781 RepID=A0A9J6NXL4_9CLOT|nr:HAMP domain-containing sensor histidine kinase [Oceanirhabdus seepicola]MCM1989194.1 HAMP domain-containing histidine kinase [Oceanirhabdus seepicola]